MDLAIGKRSTKRRSSRLFKARPASRATILATAGILFVVFSVLPILYMLYVSLLDANGDLTLWNYERLFSDPRRRELLRTSTLFGLGTSLLATSIGAPLGLLLARADLPLKRFLRIALVIPLVIPPYVVALAWTWLTGPVGQLAKVTQRDLLSGWTYSLAGAVLVLGTCFYPLAMLATEAAVRRVDGHLEEAALLVASRPRVWSGITLPLIVPAIAAAALIVFVLALAEFGVPSLLRVPVFTTEVFTTFSSFYDFGAATALAFPLVMIAFVVGFAVKLIAGEKLLTTRRSAHPGIPLTLGSARFPVLAAIVLVILVTIVLPLIVLALEAGSFERVLASTRGSGPAIANSLLLAVGGATLVILLSVFLAFARSRSRSAFRGFFDVALIVIFAVPSTVIGIGIISMWNKPGLLGAVYASQGIIIIGYLARFVPVATLMLATSIRQVPVSQEEAAEVAGAGRPRTFAFILLPQIRAGIIAAWSVVFIFAFGELGTTLLVSPPGESTLPVRVYTLIANTPTSDMSALVLMQCGVVLLPLILVGVFLRGKGDV